MLQTFVGAGLSIIVAFVINWKLAFVMLVPTMIGMGVLSCLGKLWMSFGVEEAKAYAGAGTLAQQAISSMRTVTAFNGQRHEATRYRAGLETAQQVGIKRGWAVGVVFGAHRFVIFCSNAITFFVGGLLMLNGELTGGDIFAMFQLMQAVSRTGMIANSLAALKQSQSTVAKIYQVFCKPLTRY